MVAFLYARLDEDEEAARNAGGLKWHTGCVCEDDCPGYPACERVEGDDITIYSEGGHDADQATHIARHDPDRVLREVEAKRAILDQLATDLSYHPPVPPGHQRAWAIASLTVEKMAAVYSDHPDCRPEWAPSGEPVNAP